MKCLTYYIIIIAISAVLGCQVGCGTDEKEDIGTALNEQYFADIEAETKQHLYENADWKVRWEQSRKARKRYIKLRGTYPDAALNAYTEYCNWFYYGHHLALEVAKLSVEMDIAGQSNLPDTLKLLNLQLQIAKDNGEHKDHLDELKEDILFWSELAKDLETDGGDPGEFIIEFEISEETLK